TDRRHASAAKPPARRQRRARRPRARCGAARRRSAARVSDDIFSLDGRAAVVTGGVGQLGAEIARGLVARGAKVGIFDVREGGDHGSIRYFHVDVTDRAAIEAATDELADAWGAPHVLVNAAAIDSPPDAPAAEVGPFEEYPVESFEQVMDVNVKGTFLACQVIGARMAAARRGSIVNV